MLDDYTIPQEIKSLLTEDFYKAMWDALAEIFDGKTIGVDYDLWPNVYHFEGTVGWHDAFEQCASEEVMRYYKALDWWDGDLFDGEIGDELAKRFSRPTNADKIRSMSNEELADVIEGVAKKPWYRCGDCKWESCAECCLDWLKREVDIENKDG